MAEDPIKIKLPDRWLVAAWPGMGGVAVTAGVYLLSRLPFRQISEFSARDLFEVEAADIQSGVVRAAQLPRSRLFLAEGAAGGRDVVLFLGEAQPPTGKLALCERLIAAARDLHVTRVFCFAAWAGEMDPAAGSRVRGVATDRDSLEELRRHEVAVIKEGRIAGLNGVLLAAAAERGMRGVGLLGEMPAFAPSVPYPAAAAAVLRAFSGMSGLKIDLEELEHYGRDLQKQLGDVYRQAVETLRAQVGEEPLPQARPPEPEAESPSGPDAETAARIELLFAAATRDRSKAFSLKTELDRLGVFKEYEDRFLALFKEGGA